MNNQAPRNNNQTITNNQIPIFKQKSLFGYWLLDIGICLMIGAWLLVISSSVYASEEKFFEIKAKKFVYTPNIIKVNKGDLVRIRLISEDVTHGLFIDGYGLNTSAHPGQDGALSFVASKTGRFSFRCSVTCGEFHPYMIGYLIIEPNSRFFIFTLLTLFIACAVILLINLRNKKGSKVNE